MGAGTHKRKQLHRHLLEAGCGQSEKGNATSAAALYLRAAKLGNPEAQVNLANALAEGNGVPQNFQAARRWYKCAVRHGIPEAAFNLAICYRNSGNSRMAFFWLYRAAQMGDGDATIELHQACSSGTGHASNSLGHGNA